MGDSGEFRDFSFNQKYVNNLCSKFDLKDFDVKLVLNKTDLFLVGKSFNIRISLGPIQFMFYSFLASKGERNTFIRPSDKDYITTDDNGVKCVFAKSLFKIFLDIYKHVPLWGEQKKEYLEFIAKKERYINKLSEVIPRNYYFDIENDDYFFYEIYDHAMIYFDSLTKNFNEKDDVEIEKRFGHKVDSKWKSNFFNPQYLDEAMGHFLGIIDQYTKDINKSIENSIDVAKKEGIIDTKYINKDEIEVLIKNLQIDKKTRNRITMWYIPYVYEGNSIPVVQSL